jgi:hypothetical protein
MAFLQGYFVKSMLVLYLGKIEHMVQITPRV